MVQATLQPIPIAALRQRFGWSQETLARVLGVSSRSVERWESAGRGPSDTDLLRTLDALEEVATLATEVYGDQVPRFLARPTRALGGRTPTERLIVGDREAVLGVLATAAEGAFA